MSDNTPTQRFDAPVPPESEVVQEEKKNRGLMIALIVIGAVILIAIIILLIVLLGGQGKPVAVDTKTPSPSASSASPTPSATPTATPTPTPTTTTAPPPPPSTKPAITGYSISPAKLDCSGTTPNLSIHWSSVNGKNAYFGVNTDDAMAAGMGWVLPPTGTDADFPDGYHPYAALCGNTSTEYTITILGNDGSKVSKKFVVTKQ